MAITFVGGAVNGAINGANVTLTFPGGVLENDLVIVAYAVGDNDSLDFDMLMVTAGYTEVADLHADDAQDTDIGVFWKVMAATPDTSAQVTGRGGADAAVAAVCQIFRGVDTSTPMDVTPTTATGINSNIPNPPSIDHLTPAGVWTVAAGAFGHTSGAAVTVTPPTSYDTVNDQLRSQDDTSDVTVAMAYRETPADPEDPGVFTPSIADNVAHSWCAVTIALRPAVASADTFFENRHPIEHGMKPNTAAGIGGVLIE